MDRKSIVSSMTDTGVWFNAAFYTTDGMRFEVTRDHYNSLFKLYESENYVCTASMVSSEDSYNKNVMCGGCGSYGLNNNPDGTTKPPCLIMVDVNGDTKPSPSNVNCKNSTC